MTGNGSAVVGRGGCGRDGIKGAVCCVLVVGVTLVALTGRAVASTARERILSVAASQLGYSEPGDYCSKYGPCEEWCSLFVTWVWEQAGVPVPRLGFVGDLYDWALARTYVQDLSATPTPGDAVLFGSGPENMDTSLHVGIVEDVYRTGYLVTIEGDVIHGVGRFVVPIDDPERIGEPGPIYAYASPVANGSGGHAASAVAAGGFAPLPQAPIASQEPAALLAPMPDRIAHVGVDWTVVNDVRERTIRSLRAFQHMPYRSAHIRIDWTGVDRRGLVEVRVRTAMHMSYAREAWQRFLQRFHDAARAYVVTFQAPPDVPVNRIVPSISGATTQGQTLTASDGSWSNDPTSYTYQWEDCDSSGSSCSAIAGATSQTHTLTASDIGHLIRVQETASNVGGASRRATSLPTAVVAVPSSPPATGQS
jgi:hypothetical protein